MKTSYLLSSQSEKSLHESMRWLLHMLLIAAGLALAACGGGGSGSDTAGDTGAVVIGLTDADGDFATYSVDVTSLTLTRRDGAVVNVLPLQTRVDFAQYTELTELLTAAQVSRGAYTRAEMTLDYSNADIRVALGDSVVQLDPVDTDGTAITTLDVGVELDRSKPLPIAPGIPAHLTLDFDLQATNTVDLVARTVTVLPLLVADVNPEAPKPHRARGPLLDVDVADSRFELSIRPFHLVRGDFGRLSVHTGADTVFEIDGVAYQGGAGLAALQAAPAFAATVVIGDLQLPGRVFVATEVRAGSSVAFGDSDVVSGSVTARTGDTLTVRGATLVRQDGTLSFNDDVTVLLDSTSRIVRQLDPGNSYTGDDISVGQRIRAAGSLSGAAGSYTLDTADSVVRMEVSSIAGQVVQTGSTPITMDVQSINGRPVSLYDFTGTAADPHNYRVDSDGLSLASLAADDPVRVRGFVQPFDAGVVNDFSAVGVVDLSDVPAWMTIGWTPSTAAAFSSLSSAGMVVNLDGSDLRQLVQRGVVTDLGGLPAGPTVLPQDDGKGLYAVLVSGSVQIYTTFASFTEGLTEQLGAHTTGGLLARGSWDAPSETLAGRFAAVHLQ